MTHAEVFGGSAGSFGRTGSDAGGVSAASLVGETGGLFWPDSSVSEYEVEVALASSSAAMTCPRLRS